MPPRILHVDLDAFFVAVCRQRYPEVRDVELLVVGGRSNRGVVQSASYAARKFGVHAGMPTAQAARLCPEATFFQGDFSYYTEASQAVRTVLKRHSPTVVMASLDEAYLDFGGTERLFPVSLLESAAKIRDDVRADTGLDCSIGIGPNRMIAKLASDAAKPRGLMEVRTGWEEGFLAGLPLRALPGVGPKTAERWAAFGLTEVFQVQQATLEQLTSVIGDGAAELKARAHGHGGTTLTANRLPKSIGRETTLAVDVTSLETLDRQLAIFAERVGSELREEGLVARTVTLKLRHGDFHTVTRRRTLDQPTDLDAELLAAVRAMLPAAFEEARNRGQGVRLVGLSASNLAVSAPLELFESAERTRMRSVTRAVDQVRERFGFEALTSLRLTGARRRKE
ncbi:MAG TPA: DNA polymerase IV [Gemmatimonadales bacterium]|nr:DNA polymerase IV [Gemmatimonadales bacterium]